MYSRIRNVRIPIQRRELAKFFSVDANGNPLTLGQYIELAKRGELYRVEGCRDHSREPGTAIVKAGDPVFDAESIDRLVGQYLESMGDDEVFEIVGVGSFTKAELQEQVRQRTSVGMQVIQMILDDRNFVAEQIKRGNYQELSQ